MIILNNIIRHCIFDMYHIHILLLQNHNDITTGKHTIRRVNNLFHHARYSFGFQDFDQYFTFLPTAYQLPYTYIPPFIKILLCINSIIHINENINDLHSFFFVICTFFSLFKKIRLFSETLFPFFEFYFFNLKIKLVHFISYFGSNTPAFFG